MLKRKMEKKERLEYALIILIILSGFIFDILSPFFSLEETTHLLVQQALRELMVVGYSLLAFKSIFLSISFLLQRITLNRLLK